jgi:hypothetical protein
MTSLPGKWSLTMKTPIGSIHADMTFLETMGVLTGVAVGGGDTIDLQNVQSVPVEGGQRVTWSQSIRKPMRLNLDFDVLVEGDRMSGYSRAGRLPRSSVVGERVG